MAQPVVCLCSEQSDNEQEVESTNVHWWRDYQISFGYWNDNFIATRRFEPFLNLGKDDNITSSLWLKVARSRRDQLWLLNVYHNTITNRDADYRTDLLSIYGVCELPINGGSLNLGLGFVSRGNFAGGEIQGLYHELRDFTPVQIPYLKESESGVLVMTGVDNYAISGKIWSFGGFLQNCFRGGPGPGTFRCGLKTELSNYSFGDGIEFNFQSHAGYLLAYNLDEIITPSFASRNYQAVLVSIGKPEKVIGSFWVSLNHYGIRQTYFGVALSFGGDGVRFVNLRDLMYP